MPVSEHNASTAAFGAAFLRAASQAVAWVAAACLVAGTDPAVAGARDGVVRDLHYGEVLFHFYQQDEFTALTHLLAVRQAGRVTNHAVDAELLLGGLYLSYGQTDQATAIFDRLLAESADPAVHDRAWHFIGKARYQRGLFAAADAAFERVGTQLSAALRDEHEMLRAQSLMAQGRFDDAAARLENVRSDGDWLSYVRFNLGVALVRMSRDAEGRAQLDRVGRLRSDNPELQALRDKANLALGFAFLHAQDGVRARDVLERIRLDGPHANKALLGVGWADVLQADYRQALTPWLALSDRDPLDSAVQESLLAVPYAFGRIGADGSAAEYYLGAMSSFDRELAGLDAAVVRARTGRIVPALLADDDRTIGRWHWQLDRLPDTDDARYLYRLIADHAFQDGLRSYRDLVALREHLSAWRDKLAAFENMVDTRSLAHAERLPTIERRLGGIDPGDLETRRDNLAVTLEMIEAERNVVGLADETEAEQWSRLAALESSPAWAAPEAAEARDRWRVLRGVLLWRLDADYRYRLWQARRNLAELDRGLAETAKLSASARLARADRPADLDTEKIRIAALKPRIDVMQARIDEVLQRQETHLQAVIAAELEAQKRRLASYRIQARFALASIYDRTAVAAAGTEVDDATAPAGDVR